MEERITRFGVSIDEPLLARFDDMIARRHYTNRSEALRDLIRRDLAAEEWENGAEEAIGALTLLYDHHVPKLAERLNHLQHDHIGQIMLSSHVHLDHRSCLEVLIVRGSAGKIRDLADRLRSLRGVEHATLSMTAAGKRPA